MEPAAGRLAAVAHTAGAGGGASNPAEFSASPCRLTGVQQVPVQLYIRGGQRTVLLQMRWQQPMVAIRPRLLG